MPRRPRLAAGDLAYHVLNRRVGRLPLFDKSADYAVFEKVLAEAHAQTGIRIAAYRLMPNHWHLLLWPRQDGELSEVLRWMTVTHTQRWHAHHHTAGTGPVYQGRFKSFPVQTGTFFDGRAVCGAQCVAGEAGGPGGGLAVVEWVATGTRGSELTTWLSAWPMERPRDWEARVNRSETASELEALRLSVQRGRPFDAEAWVRRMATRFGLESTMRARGRPRES